MLRSPRLAKTLFAVPMAVFGLLHFGPLEFSLPYVPAWLPAPAFWIYLAGAGLLAFALSVALGRFDRIAARLLALELLLFVLLTHLPNALDGDFVRAIAVFRDVAMAGAALMYAEGFARDRRTGFRAPRPASASAKTPATFLA